MYLNGCPRTLADAGHAHSYYEEGNTHSSPISFETLTYVVVGASITIINAQNSPCDWTCNKVLYVDRARLAVCRRKSVDCSITQIGSTNCRSTCTSNFLKIVKKWFRFWVLN